MKRLQYRSISAGFIADIFGAPFPDWVRNLKKKSGVYVIRDLIDKQPLYVGESHSGKLYDTLTRHFQKWTGKTAGPTYARGQVTVAVRTTPAARAVDMQNELICRLRPRDNEQSPLCALDNEDPF